MLNDRPEPGISYQLYSSRKFARVAETIAMLGGLGYDQAEGYGDAYDDISTLRLALDGVGMTMPTGHFPLPLLEEEPEKAIDIARTLGMSVLFCPSLGRAEYPVDAQGWQAVGTRLDRVGARLAKAGLRFGWHNHDYEFQPLPDGSLPMDHIFAGAPELAWQIDVAWTVAGGQSPEDLIKRHASRILSAHVKDIAPIGTNSDQDGWTDVGKGTLEWRSLFSALGAIGCSHFVIEHDNPADDRAFASASIAAVREY